jgi:DNA polymerase I
VRDLTSGEAVAYGPSEIEKGLARLDSAATVWYHNGVAFDVPAIKKVYPKWTPKALVQDTMVGARLVYPNLKDTDWKRIRMAKLPSRLAGSHKLEAWGWRLGLHKGDYEGGWEAWSQEMQDYCVQDTAVTAKLANIIIPRLATMPRAWDQEIRLAEYLERQMANGWPFDVDAARDLQGTLAAKREELGDKLRQEFGSWYQRGAEFTPKKNDAKRGYYAGAPMTKLKVIEFNPASRPHIANRLTTLYGWKPTSFTETGLPQVDESALKGMTFPAAPVLIEYLTVDKRLGQLSEGKEAWLKHLKDDGCIHGYVNQSGCVTHRATHSHPNIAQVPTVNAPYGSECRSLFRVPAGWRLMGADASGLELRCLAHYLAKYDGGTYAKVLLEGDPHAATRDALELEPTKEMREIAKRWRYAYLYGAGDEKLGWILNPGATPQQQAKLGKTKRALFLKANRAEKQLLDAISKAVKTKGYLTVLDGRKVYIRSDHAALNSLLQTTGAVICKQWLVEYDSQMTAAYGPQGWGGQWAALGWIHDEAQVAIRPDIAEAVCKVAVRSIEVLTNYYHFRCPLTGEARIGANWKETH